MMGGRCRYFHDFARRIRRSIRAHPAAFVRMALRLLANFVSFMSIIMIDPNPTHGSHALVETRPWLKLIPYWKGLTLQRPDSFLVHLESASVDKRRESKSCHSKDLWFKVTLQLLC